MSSRKKRKVEKTEISSTRKITVTYAAAGYAGTGSDVKPMGSGKSVGSIENKDLDQEDIGTPKLTTGRKISIVHAASAQTSRSEPKKNRRLETSIPIAKKFCDRDYFSALELKANHENLPIWVCPDRRIYLEAFSPFYNLVRFNYFHLFFNDNFHFV